MNHSISFLSKKTKDFLFDLRPELQQPISFQRAQSIASKLGCSIEGGETRFLFWNPDFKEAEQVSIELFIPNSYLNFDKPEQHASFHYFSFAVLTEKEFAAAVLKGIPAGSEDQFGALYQLKATFPDGRETIIRDPLAASMPYGIHAPSEVYDVEKMFSERSDRDYFKTLQKNLDAESGNRVKPSVNLLEVHVQTATKHGTLYSLTQRFKQISAKIESGTELTPDEKNLCGFDAIELMPLDPVIEHPDHHQFWDPVNRYKENGDEVTVRLRKPEVLNWGYDITIFGAAAINPSLLSTGRPGELLGLIETLHNFPEPMKVVLDIVFGHADHQAIEVLHDVYFAGPNMYGQDIRFQHPLVRAIILELQKRKIDYGFDGVRVDGSQDFKQFNKGGEKLQHDDAFLKEMSNIQQHVAGVTYRPWMIFEDGRPWPRDDWELASTYREVTKNQPHAFQWAPMIFAYNTPYNYTYWVSKWWRLREQFLMGEKWITGYSNHDTMRRGTQADPEPININTMLGNSLKMVMDNAYNHPATTLLMNAFLPGVPMDFLQALGSTPWSFIRDTDKKYSVKVAAEESHFLEWQVTDNEFRQSRFFKRLKHMGFNSLGQLRSFLNTLHHLVIATGYDMDKIVNMINGYDHAPDGNLWTEQRLQEFARAWMSDLNCYCNVDHHAQYINGNKAAFNLNVRKFRLQNPWLIRNFSGRDQLKYVEPVNGTVIYYGFREDPLSGKKIVFVANMEGQPKQIVPLELGLPVEEPEKWRVACSTPNITRKEISEPIRLSISQGLLFEKSS